MFDIILLLIILFALIQVIIQNFENMSDHNFKYLNSKSSLFLNNDLYSSNELIEIKSLPSCQVNFTFDYGSNYNSIVNNNVSIYQDIIDPLEHTIELDNVNYNLTSVRWKLSKFTYENNQVGLDLHLVHQNYNSLHKLIIVVPLSLKNDDIKPIDNQKEQFKNVGYKKLFNNLVQFTDTKLSDNSIKDFVIPAYYQIKDKTKILMKSQKNMFNLKLNNIKNKIKHISLNKLITSPVLVPDYECCADKIGQSSRFNLCDIQQILQENKTYYQLEDREANKYFISEPQEFNEDVGLEIMNKLKTDDTVFYLKNSSQ